ncbi:MAG: lysozyme [Treponema sp.]|nr:lysozyme [Treponema sp.]
MGKTIGNAGLEIIKQFEVCKLKAYKNNCGVWCIGYTHTRGVIPNMQISQSEADSLLIEDVQKIADAVDNSPFIQIPLSDEQRDALICFAYNTGFGNLKKLCENRNAQEIAESILKYNKIGNTINENLTKRRQAEHDLFCSNIAG